MGREAGEQFVVTQASFGGFNREVTAKELVRYLENEIGGIMRCRLKKSWTPLETTPKFDVDISEIAEKDDYLKVEPHAFVHFLLPDSANKAMDKAGSCELLFHGYPLKVRLGPENILRSNQRRQDVNPFRLYDVGIELGSWVDRDLFFIGWKGPVSGVDFLVDPFDGTCRFCFTRKTAFKFKSTNHYTIINCNFKIDFLVRDIHDIKQYREKSCLGLMLQLTSSPRVCYRTADDDIEKPYLFETLDDDDPWIRTTDFTPSGAIGRCNSFRISIPPRCGPSYNKAIKYLKERRVLEDTLKFQLKVKNEPDFGAPLSDPLFSIHHKEGISFKVLFMVNSVMHKGIFNEHQLTDEFYDLLREQPLEINVAALKHIWSHKHPDFDAYKRLKLVQNWLLDNPKHICAPPQIGDLVEVHRLVITPSKAYCLPPEVQLSNRVLRHYKEISDRFLRVTFMDEGMQSLNPSVLSYHVAPIVRDITSNSYTQKTLVFDRVKSLLWDGFYLCGRKYTFLAFSSNQLRDRSTWFFAEDKTVKVTSILKWMGKFSNRNIAKCAARMGQCFSSTYATVEVPSSEVNFELPDIKRNNYVFSDGIGKITPDLAMEVAKKLKLDLNPPSAYQIRFAGCKGVVACWPQKEDGIKLSLRPSMNKFTSDHRTLEICSWTKFQPGFLNRQIVTLLSALEVEDDIFRSMQESMVSTLNDMLVDKDAAFDVLYSSCSDQGNTAAMMLSAGFMPKDEPHLRGMLTCIRAAQLWGLREKTRISVASGRWLMGCFDELGVLEQGQCFIQVSAPSLEKCFAKHGSKFSDTKRNLQVVKGIVVIAKNPCLHPGDVRILEAVDAPELHHLYDCLVFPQNGDRPHANEASGSDLDGDLYFVNWDERLIPPRKESWPPMMYESGEAKTLKRDVTHPDIKKFFLEHMVNENLGHICNAHVVHADRSEYGALDENCIELAKLAAIAVDTPKTGEVAKMPYHLKPKLYPDFMGKEEHQSYKSTRILGELYRKIRDAYDEDISKSSEMGFVPSDIPYDKKLEVSGSDEFIMDAWEQKGSYDSQLLGLLGQYKVKREEELVTGHIWSMPKHTSKKQGDLKEKLQHSYSALRKEFRQKFEMLGSDLDVLTDEERNELYEKKASAWYQVTYHPQWVKESLKLQDPGNAENVKILSFPWIATDYLVRIKIRGQDMGNIDFSKPVNALVKFLANKI
ncbi:hypothetical protein ACFE04_014070 [Oxalis oulophora]